MDGMFVPNITIGPVVIESIRPLTGLPFDVHLMIEDPLRYLDSFAEAGADILTVHAEAGGDVRGAMDRIHELGLKAGISLNPDTPVDVLEPFLPLADLVLVMTVQPGFGGQAFRESGIPKIAWLSRWAETSGQDLDISVDGGINRDTGRRCAEAGATVLAAGSSLFRLQDMTSEIALWKTFGARKG
jgi:ribulose-phosphate 3-epimerase